jgi:hypothetical protein
MRSQPRLQPDLYGAIDFDQLPFRFTTDPTVATALPNWVAPRDPLLADDDAIELMQTATMLGDVVADPYAALISRCGMHSLISMLRQACREGIEAVPDAPDELASFVRAMEIVPAWVDMALVEEGARHSRVSAAFLAPFLTRGAFLATFLNTYAALPMALTGALSSRRAAVRVNETASFFAVTTLPGALDRHGQGFEAAAMVRLMHSVVRVNALTRFAERWDATVYGIPVPQVDQMPAGLINIYILAMNALRKGRTEFNDRERSMLEFARYRAFLLGLPEELLPTTVADIVKVFHARAAVLRDDFDDATCGELVRSTMSAHLRSKTTPFDRAADAVEKSWSRFFFWQFTGRDRIKAASMSVEVSATDLLVVGLTSPFILGRFLIVLRASRLPVLRQIADNYTVRRVEHRLRTYGVPAYTTDVSRYRAADRGAPA